MINRKGSKHTTINIANKLLVYFAVNSNKWPDNHMLSTVKITSKNENPRISYWSPKKTHAYNQRRHFKLLPARENKKRKRFGLANEIPHGVKKDFLSLTCARGIIQKILKNTGKTLFSEYLSRPPECSQPDFAASWSNIHALRSFEFPLCMPGRRKNWAYPNGGAKWLETAWAASGQAVARLRHEPG